MNLSDLTHLEQRVQDLIELCDRLSQENKLLRANAAAWKGERAELIRRNDLARSKVESMIARLKALEQDT